MNLTKPPRMSQSKTFCPHCDRAPGGVHLEVCPRSRVRLAALHVSLTKRPRLLWKKGLVMFHDSRRFMRWNVLSADNPGIPRVVHGSNPRAGGVPHGKKKEAGIFLRALGLEKTP